MINTNKFISKCAKDFTLLDHHDFFCALTEYFREKLPTFDTYNYANYITRDEVLYLFNSYADFGKYCADPFIHQEVDQELDWHSYGKRIAETVTFDPRNPFIVLEYNSKIFSWEMREDLLMNSHNNLAQTQ